MEVSCPYGSRDGSLPWWAHQPWGRRKPRPHSPLDRLRVRPARLEIRALFLRDFCGALLPPPIRLKARVLDVLELGHATGVFAPGLKLPPGRLNQLRRRVLLAHGLAVQAIRARSRAGTQVGPAENVNVSVPVVETPEHIAAAERATREVNAPYLTAMMEGRYRESFLAAAGVDAPKVAAGDMSVISTSVDFVGLNIYLPGSYVSARDDAPGFVAAPFPAKFPTMNSTWLKIGPEALYWGPRNVAKVWNVSDIYITENGCSATDVPAADGVVYDTDRIMFLRSYLTQLQRATSEGVPVRGYFHWSLMDNFEWADGFGTRFGLLYVDYATQQRTPKLSASFYREVAGRNRLA